MYSTHLVEFTWHGRALNPMSYLLLTEEINGQLAVLLSGSFRTLECLVHGAKKSVYLSSDLSVYSLVVVVGDATFGVRNSSFGKEHAMQTLDKV